MILVVILLGYLIGSVPMGYLFVKLLKQQDITQVGSGRTGGTNAMRAAGVGAGILTAVFDILKGFLSVMLARWLLPGNIWAEVLSGVAAVFGHNWSIWVFWLSQRFSGGAGTAPNIGAAIAFWPPVMFITIPLMALLVFVVGYASFASLVTALALVAIFYFRFVSSGTPWEYVVYSLMTTVIVIIALLPNIKRLRNGTERRVGIFAKKSSTKEQVQK